MHHLTVDGNPNDTWEVVDAAARSSMADEYSSSSTYAVGDICMHNGQLYECNTAINTAEEWNSSHWTSKTVADELSDLKHRYKELNMDMLSSDDNLGQWDASYCPISRLESTRKMR